MAGIIDDKIGMFSEIVNEKIEQERAEKLKLFEAEKLKILSELENEIKMKKEIDIIEFIKKSNSKKSEIISKESLKAKKEILELKKNYMNQVMEEIKNKLVNFTNEDSYKEFLLHLIKNNVKNEDEVVVYLNKKDYEKYANLIKETLGESSEVKADEKEFIGGAIIANKKGKFKLDFSIDNKLFAMKDKIGLKVMESLGQEV